MRNTLSEETMELMDSYLNLPIGAGCATPYFNNRRAKIRGGLSGLVGKGSPKEITTEAKIIATRKKINLSDLNSEGLKRFLVENGLGIDCSGLAFHLLNTESKARGLGSFASGIKSERNFIRKILYRLRPEVNTNVEVFASQKNSLEINLKDAEAGDIITMMKTGPRKNYNHILVIKDISTFSTGEKIINYVHSYSWPTDGKYEHGVRFGSIHIKNLSQPLALATWSEKGVSGSDNYTFVSLEEAQEVSVRRLVSFAKNS